MLAALVLVLIASLLAPVGEAKAQQQAPRTSIYVSPSGDDSRSGRRPDGAGGDGPVATLERARDLVRAMKAGAGLPSGGVSVVLAPGTYRLAQPLELTDADSGGDDAPVVYRAAGGEVVLSGGVALRTYSAVSDPAVLNRLPEAARRNVVEFDLPANGVTTFPGLQRVGFRDPSVTAPLDIFVRGQPMQLARWPNEGFLTIAEVPDGLRGRRFSYQGDAPPQPWSEDERPWIYGYYVKPFADEYNPVASVDPASRMVTLTEPAGRLWWLGLAPGGRFYFLNVLGELDQPGEWYLDSGKGKLYFWPPQPLQPGDVDVSVTETLLSLSGARNVRFEGMTVELSRGAAVVIGEGEGNSLRDCTIRNVGGWGATVTGQNNGVVNCQAFNLGEGGVNLQGGDRQTLTPAGLYAERNRIHDYGRWRHTYRPAVEIGGVGNRAAHNQIYNAPHQGM
ncbi:MAG TPA: right-handed parallel beta-helix repeat-containing protein, partial [Rhodospirillales bacterium]|nr:right-handed parallel beta-helix repeat-containing protein [Rhodospirillales bacterium]